MHNYTKPIILRIFPWCGAPCPIPALAHAFRFPVSRFVLQKARDILLLEPGRARERSQHVPNARGPLPPAAGNCPGPGGGSRNARSRTLPSLGGTVLCHSSGVYGVVRGRAEEGGENGCGGGDGGEEGTQGCAPGISTGGGVAVPEARHHAAGVHLADD